MTIIEHRPCASLSRYVRRISHYSDPRALAPEIEPAGLVLPLIFVLSGSFRFVVGDASSEEVTLGSFMAGMITRPVMVASSGATECLQIDLTPIGAARLLDRPIHGLAESLAPIDTLDDAQFGEVEDRLANLNDPQSRFELAERWVKGRILSAGRDVAWIEAAYDALASSGGQVRVGDLAERVGRSRQRLSSAMTEHIGVSPKTLARVARFEAARRMMMRPDLSGWADLAAACGYSDQSHLVREFRALGGRPPGVWPQ